MALVCTAGEDRLPNGQVPRHIDLSNLFVSPTWAAMASAGFWKNWCKSTRRTKPTASEGLRCVVRNCQELLFSIVCGAGVYMRPFLVSGSIPLFLLRPSKQHHLWKQKK